MERTDFLIIGAGIAGASLAYHLAGSGSVRLCGAGEFSGVSHNRALGFVVQRNLWQCAHPQINLRQPPFLPEPAARL